MIRLTVDSQKIDKARQFASETVKKIIPLLQDYSSISIERTVLRLFGIDGCTRSEEPYPNIVVDHLLHKGVLERGAAFWLGNAIAVLKQEPQEIAELIEEGDLDLTNIDFAPSESIFKVLEDLTDRALKRIRHNRTVREELITKYGKRRTPSLYLIVATGNIYEDITQAKAAARQGADIIAVIRSTAQSLLDYVPYGPTTTGFGGTFATQENFRIMRKALDEVSSEENRYIYLTNYASGLCMPEIAAMAALERLDILLNDAMYGILFRDINMKRTFLDQYFSRMINAYAGIEIQTGEDNYLTTSDAIEKAYTVTASQLINEQFALLSGIKHEKMGLGHAFEINPDEPDSVLYEIAHALLSKTLFPDSPIKYMPPTKFASGNIFKTYIMNSMFNFVSQLTGQGVQLLGMMTEAIHTPHLVDRALAVENAQYIFKCVENLASEFTLKPDKFINQRANIVLDQAIDFLRKVAETGLMDAMANGAFADIKRNETGGKGLDGVFKKEKNYTNPFMEKMKVELKCPM